MHLNEHTGELEGKVEMPPEGWFSKWAFRMVLKGTDLPEIMSYPLKGGKPFHKK